jgi:glutaminyl-peptide cyclotransferase
MTLHTFAKAVKIHITVLVFLFSLQLSAQDRIYGYRVLNTYPHDANAFTQGLLYRDGFLFEGTGRFGQSSLRRINLEDGKIIHSTQLSDRYFGEGIEMVGERIYQLTWQSHIVFVYDKESFAQLETHFNPSEGWGLTYDGQHLILSDGSDTLQFIDPENFITRRRIKVTLNDNPINQLNELEYINGEVWANVWQSDFIVRIDPASGKINSVIDLRALTASVNPSGNDAVLNGIAWDAEGERLFVTGKLWPSVFEIELTEP